MPRTASSPSESVKAKVIVMRQRIRKEAQSLPKRRKAPCPDKTRVRGYYVEDERCADCSGNDYHECVEATLKRLLSVKDDLNRKLGLELDAEHWTYQGQAGEVADQFEEWRQEIRDALVEWSKGESDTNEVREKVELLHGATLRFLDKTWPEWRQWAKRFVDSVHVTSAEDAEKLKWSLRMPYYILDSNMRDMSGNTWKVFCYISRRATFDPSSNIYGRCYLGYDEIKTWTGVKQPERCIKELEQLGLLKVENIRRVSNGEIRTTNLFTVTWFHDFKKMGVDGYDKR